MRNIALAKACIFGNIGFYKTYSVIKTDFRSLF